MCLFYRLQSRNFIDKCCIPQKLQHSSYFFFFFCNLTALLSYQNMHTFKTSSVCFCACQQSAVAGLPAGNISCYHILSNRLWLRPGRTSGSPSEWWEYWLLEWFAADSKSRPTFQLFKGYVSVYIKSGPRLIRSLHCDLHDLSCFRSNVLVVNVSWKDKRRRQFTINCKRQ